MKYNGNINYIKCIEYGLNLTQGAVMDSFGYLSSWAEGKTIEGDIYYYLSAGKLVEELPIISDKKNTFLVIIKKLIEKELIKRKIEDNKSYYKITEKGISFFSDSVEKNQHSVEKNQGGVLKKIKRGVEKNQDNNNTSYNTTNNNIYIDLFNEFWNKYPRKINKKKTGLLYKNLYKKHDDIMAGLNNYIYKWDKEGTENEFIPHPTSWLNGERRTDDIKSDVKLSLEEKIRLQKENYLKSLKPNQ